MSSMTAMFTIPAPARARARWAPVAPIAAALLSLSLSSCAAAHAPPVNPVGPIHFSRVTVTGAEAGLQRVCKVGIESALERHGIASTGDSGPELTVDVSVLETPGPALEEMFPAGKLVTREPRRVDYVADITATLRGSRAPMKLMASASSGPVGPTIACERAADRLAVELVKAIARP